MEKKTSSDQPESTRDENAYDSKVVDGVVDHGGRRESVAHNVIHNPLKVSKFCSAAIPHGSLPFQLLTQVFCSIVQNKSEGDVVNDAREWAQAHGMPEHAELFGRAALVARDPERFEMLGEAELEPSEREALVYERDHKWHGPTMLWYSISLCAIGAATQGWDQTGANGANLSFPQEFGIDKEGRDEWIVGLINSIIFLTAGLM